MYDLEERTARFGEAVVRFAKKLPVNAVNSPLMNQVVRSATSVGANYSEADDAGTKKEFMHKIGTCKREARETKHWLRMIAAAEAGLADEARDLWKEARELHLVFAAITRRGKD
ncbi:MAG TPA: four helix bundle protein [Verrucomicrobiae bacterium]|nr:four helix bundle protein [Verrucomicrobiae bacterium]